MNKVDNEAMGEVMDLVSQSEAAVLAVVCAAVRERAMCDGDVEAMTKYAGGLKLLEEVEKAMLESIAKNDGMVTYWVSVAAKQVNPMLG